MTVISSSPSDSFSKTWIPPILFYCVSSIAMTVTNKLVFALYPFKMLFLVLTIQSFACVFFLEVFQRLGGMQFRRIDWHGTKNWISVSIAMCLMLLTSGKSLEYLKIATFTIFKNLTIGLIAYGEKYTANGAVTNLMLVSFILMVISSFVSAGADLQFGGVGYVWVILNCLISSFYVLYMRRIIKKLKFKDFDTVYYNNFLATPMFVILSYFFDDWALLHVYPLEVKSFFIVALSSGLVSFFISYGSAWCVRIVNSTTYSMVGALNKLPISIAGLIVFGDPATLGNISGILLAFAAGIIYTKAKLNYDRSRVIIKSALPISNDSGLGLARNTPSTTF